MSTLDNLQSATNTDAELAALERTKEDTQERYEEALERIMTTIEELKTPNTIAQAQQVNQQGGAQAAPAQNRQNTPKIIDSLKPEKLTEEHTPIEFRAWKAQWSSFFNASNLHVLDLSLIHI